MPVIVSAFGPWGSVDENPTALVLARLAARRRPGLVTLALPVASDPVAALVADALDTHKPALWLGLGLAMGHAAIAVERVAVNIRDFAEPDTAGAQPQGVPVVPDGPAALFSTLPVPGTVAALRAAGIPARLSNSASTFLCNELMYRVLHGVAARGLPTRFGFLHVPAHPALVARQPGRAGEQPSMSLDLIEAAVDVVLAQAGAAADDRRRIEVANGRQEA